MAIDVPDSLERRVGPFPIIAWAGLIAGGAALGLVLRKRMKSKPSAPDEIEQSLPDIEGSSSSSGFAASSAASSRTGVPTVYTPAPSVQVPTVDVPTTNLAWGQRVITGLTSQGLDALSVDTAIRKYLSGLGLNSGERAIVTRALGSYGPPPEDVPPVVQIPDEVPTTPTPIASVPTPPPPPPAATIRAPGALVSDDGNTVLWLGSDGQAVKWVSNGHESVALWRAGAATAGDNGQYPYPKIMSREAIRAVPNKIGPPPPEWGQW